MTLKIEIDQRDWALRVAILVDENAVWPHPDIGDEASDFDPEDVLSFLVDAWPSLLITQSFPIPFSPHQMPRSLTGLAGAAEERWKHLGEADDEMIREEQARLDAFLYYHDLSQMKFGAGLEEFFVLRSGSRMRIETFGEIIKGVSFREFVTQMECLGQEAARMLGADHSLVDRWNNRSQIDPVRTCALMSGVPLAAISSHQALLEPLISEIRGHGLPDIANDNGNPIYAAARAAGSLGVTTLHDVTSRVRNLQKKEGLQIKKLRRHVHNRSRDMENPTDQGIRTAFFIRDSFKISNSKVDLQKLSDELDVRVERISIPDRRLDGIAVMPGSHGPAILLNKETRRRGAGPDDLERSLRFTWAHEIGHLLLDDPDECPALVDACDDHLRHSRDVETRANAFAAYLLLPPALAWTFWVERQSPLDWAGLEKVLNELTEVFGLPRIVASRQLHRGIQAKSSSLGGLLRELFQRNIENF